MRVLWFTNTPSLATSLIGMKGIGGGWIETLESALNRREDIELGIVFKTDKPELYTQLTAKTTYFPVKRRVFLSKIRGVIQRWQHPIDTHENLDTYLAIIKDFKPDLIHIFGTESEFGLVISEIKVPVVIHIQGNLNVIRHRWFSGISKPDLMRYSRKMTVLKGYGLLHDYYICRKEAERERQIYGKCNYFMGRTEWDRHITRTLSPSATYFHCDEILHDIFYERIWRPGHTTNNLKLFSTIRNSIYKGLETILESKILLDQATGLQSEWLVAGVGAEDEISDILERKYGCSFESKSIKLLGNVHTSQLLEYMMKADMFIHPSHVDNSPNSLCEAMLIGMPVIATFTGGIPSLIENRKEGLLYQDGDPYALTGAILELSQDKDLCMQLGDRARLRALKRHEKDSIIETVVNIYSSIIASNH